MVRTKSEATWKEIVKGLFSTSVRAFTFVEEESERFGKRLAEGLRLSPEERKDFIQEIGREVRKNAQEVEGWIEEGVRLSLPRMAIPSQKDVQEIEERIEKLEKRVKALVRKRKKSSVPHESNK